MLSFPQTPQALVVRKLRRRPSAAAAAPPASVTSATFSSHILMPAMSPGLATTPSAARNPAARSMSSPGVRMVTVSAAPFRRISSGSSTASRSARGPASRGAPAPSPACTRSTRRRAVRPVMTPPFASASRLRRPRPPGCARTPATPARAARAPIPVPVGPGGRPPGPPLAYGPSIGIMAGAAGIVLAGGRSSRMGTPKAALEWHGSTLLWRTAGILARATGGPVVVVRAPGQELPALPPGTEVVPDPREGLGPLQGIAAGLAALSGRAEAAFVSSTDLPFLHPAFVRRVLRATADGADVGLPVARGYQQPLAAAYRVALAPLAAGLVARQVRAATVAGAAAAAGLEFGGRVLAVLDGGLVTTGGQTPLAAGDTVTFQL